MLKHLYPVDLIIKIFKENCNVTLSKEFIACADIQLTQDFLLHTGIKIGKYIGIGFSSKPFFFYNRGEVSKMHSFISINSYGNEVSINWKSKSGRIYETFDTDIDCNDITFWFEGLDPLEYHKQLQPNNSLPFKLKDLTYELIITALNMDMTIEMWLKEDDVAKAPALLEDIDKMMDDFNMKSMKKDRKDGVVHNWKRRNENDKLIYDIDTGSAGVIFLKKFLMYLSKSDRFTRVEIS